MAKDGFTAAERAAMKERAAELKTSARRSTKADKAAADVRDCLDKIEAMPDGDRAIAEMLHRIVTTEAPELAPKTWYGMPAYAKDGKVVVFYKGTSKFGARYAEVGFNETALLDEGVMWPTVYAVTAVTPGVEAKLTELIRTAVG